MKLYDNEYKSDDGKIFVVTEKGANESGAYCRGCEVGKPRSDDYFDERYAPAWAVDNGYLKEVPDPEWITLPGYKVVYYHNGYEVCAGNPIVFHDREMAERYAKHYADYPWMRDNQLIIVDAIYEGKRPIPCREYNGKRVYNDSYFTFDGAEIGDYVEEDIVIDMINCVPPASTSAMCMQCGEPADHMVDENGNCKAVYSTFKKVTAGIYEYCGKCFRGKNEQTGKPMPYVA